MLVILLAIIILGIIAWLFSTAGKGKEVIEAEDPAKDPEVEALLEIELKNVTYESAVSIAETSGYEVVKADPNENRYILRLRKI